MNFSSTFFWRSRWDLAFCSSSCIIEVNPVMSALLNAGLDVTALHNHFFFDEPRMFYMHVHGHGSTADLTKRIKPALDLIGASTKGAQPPASSAAGRSAATRTTR